MTDLDDGIQCACKDRDVLVALWENLEQVAVGIQLVAKLVERRRDLPAESCLPLRLDGSVEVGDQIEYALDGRIERFQIQLIVLGTATAEKHPFLTELGGFDGDDSRCGTAIRLVFGKDLLPDSPLITAVDG